MKKAKARISSALLPSLAELETERARLNARAELGRTLRGTLAVLLVVAASAVLVATLLLPVLRIYGNSMSPTLAEGELMVAVKGSSYEQGDLVCFYYGNKILVKRCIARSGQWVNIDENGVVSVDGQVLDEPYVTELSKGDCSIELPYQVPEGRIFVLGDNRATSVDSRSSVVGCVSEEQMIGKLFLRVWPLNKLEILA